MLKYVIALCIISFCDSTKRQSGNYSELVFVQGFPITEFFYEYVHYPFVYIGSSEYLNFIGNHSKIFAAKQWIIHGLWSFDSEDKYLSKCVSSLGNRLSLDSSLLDPILKRELQAKWPVISITQDTESAWWIEYHESGSCVTEDPVSYFKGAVQLFDKYNVGRILGNGRISVGTDYNLTRIIDTIAYAVQKKIIVRCLETKTQEQYLMEVQICFNRKHHIQDCKHRLPADKDKYPCKFEKLVKYPLVPERYKL